MKPVEPRQLTPSRSICTPTFVWADLILGVDYTPKALNVASVYLFWHFHPTQPADPRWGWADNFAGGSMAPSDLYADWPVMAVLCLDDPRDRKLFH